MKESSSEPINPYAPPESIYIHGDGVISWFMWIPIFILVPVTAIYIAFRGYYHCKAIGVVEITIVEIITRLQWPIGWMALLLWLAYRAVVVVFGSASI